MRNVYLDYGAATPVDNRVIKAMQPFLKNEFYNPSAIYLKAKKTKELLESARSSVAKILGAKPAEIVFTAGGTEANNLAIFGVANKFPGSHIVTTALEHDSVLMPIQHLAKNGWQINEVRPTQQGIIEPKTIAKAINDKTTLVSVMYANNEIGTVQPIRQIAREINKVKADRQKRGVKTPIYLHSDACQAANYLDSHVNNLGVDLMTINGGKIYGPKQSGALFVNSDLVLMPLIFGGGQELGLRSGTQNIAGSVGLAKALEIAVSKRASETKRLRKLQAEFIKKLSDKIPNLFINGSLKQRLPNNIHLSLSGQDNERLIYVLDELGIQCAAGAACSASKEEPSHVLKAIGRTDADARSSLRITMGRSTSKLDLNYFVDSLKKALT